MKILRAAGILLFRPAAQGLEVLLVHPGGPFWAGKDFGAWSIPKGEIGPGEDPLEAARREFSEETGWVPDGPFMPLTPVKQRGGKVVQAWAVRGDWDPSRLISDTFTMEWPPRSGRTQQFPEVDRAAWFALPEGRRRILPGQIPLLEELAAKAPE